MPNARKKLFAPFASSILLAASALVASPAPARTVGEAGGGSSGPGVCCATWGCIPPGGVATCCVYDEGLDGWYRFYVWGYEPCDPYLAPTETDRPS